MQLNEYLQPLNAPVTQKSSSVTGYEFATDNERGALISQGFFGTAVVDDVNIVNLSADKLTAGTVTVSLGVGGANVTIDGTNNRILVNDGTNDRVLIGQDTGGF